jgi:hypothetical protein
MTVGTHWVFDAVGEIHQIDDPADFGAVGEAAESSEDFEVLPAAEVVVKCGGFEDGTDFAQGAVAFSLDGDAINADLALIGIDHAEHAPEQGAFAGAIVAEETKDFTFSHREAYGVNGLAFFGEGFGDGVDFNHGGP